MLGALVVGAAQQRGQVVVFAAPGAQRRLALEAQRQRHFQAGPRLGVGELLELALQLLVRGRKGVQLLRGIVDRALQLGAPGGQRAR